MIGHNLGFRIEDDESVRFDDGSWRFATPEEGAMWERLQAADEALDAAVDVSERKRPLGHLAPLEYGVPIATLDAFENALAAFRADKEEQR